MNVTVLMASGDEDTWQDVVDAVVDEGSLLVLDTPDDEVYQSGEPYKLITLTEGQVEKQMAVLAMYAPGMWMKVEYDAGS